MAEPARLLALAEAVADGKRLDWADVESGSVTHEERELVKELRLLAGVSEAHRRFERDPSSTTGAGDLAVPQRWGPLQIRERLSSGTFGSVYRAWDSRLERDVALKLLHVERAAGDWTPTVIEEGRLLARVKHGHVITVFGADQFDGRVGIWMDLIHGRTLEDVLQQDGALGAREAALVGVDLCGALAAVHAVGLVHRDVKTRNVMREEGGRIVLMDFGAGQDGASSTGTSGLTGTPVYMAPELFAGQSSTPASDLYSLGVLLFRLVTGKYPVNGRTLEEVRHAHERNERLRLRDVRPDLPLAFVQAVERALEPSPAKRVSSAGALESDLADSIRSVPWWVAAMVRPRALVAACLFVLLVAVAGLMVWKPWRADGFEPAALGSVRTIAVRPVEDLTRDAPPSIVAAGLYSILLSRLAGIRAIHVFPLEVSEPGKSPSVAEIRKRFHNASDLLEMTVRREGARVQIDLRVVRLATGALIWGHSFEGDDHDLFTLEGTIATELARNLRLPVSDQESQRLALRYSPSAEALDAYLRGHYLLGTLARNNLSQARVALESATKATPGFAPAWASLALTYLAQFSASDLSPDQVRALAPYAAARALDADPTSPEALLAVADVKFRLDRDWQGARETYQRVTEANPSYADARDRYARFLAADNRPLEALAEAEDALSFNQTSDALYVNVGMALYYGHEYGRAIAHLTARPLDRSAGGQVILGRAYAAAGMYPQALQALAKGYELSDSDASIRAEEGRTLAEAGQIGRAREILHELEAQRPAGQSYLAPQDLAYIHIALGEFDLAIPLLETALDERASRLLFLAVDPRVDALRPDPRFQVLLKRLGR